MVFDEVVEEYCELPQILLRFNEWKKKDMNAYKEAYVHMCLPKVVSIFARAEMILWSPFEPDNYEDIEKMSWYHPAAMYGRSETETEETLRNDPDVYLVPTVVEKIVLAKLCSELKGFF
jgi:GC-rich sequence DNA-binding factor